MGKLAEEKTIINWKRDRTVLCIFDNSSLRTRLENWAKDNSYRLVWGRPDYPDIIAFPCIAMIVDRDYIDMDEYESYLQYAEEVNGPFELSESNEDEKNDVEIVETLTSKADTVCIIIDSLRDIEYPMVDNVFQINPEQDRA